MTLRTPPIASTPSLALPRVPMPLVSEAPREFRAPWHPVTASTTLAAAVCDSRGSPKPRGVARPEELEACSGAAVLAAVRGTTPAEGGHWVPECGPWFGVGEHQVAGRPYTAVDVMFSSGLVVEVLDPSRGI